MTDGLLRAAPIRSAKATSGAPRASTTISASQPEMQSSGIVRLGGRVEGALLVGAEREHQHGRSGGQAAQVQAGLLVAERALPARGAARRMGARGGAPRRGPEARRLLLAVAARPEHGQGEAAALDERGALLPQPGDGHARARQAHRPRQGGRPPGGRVAHPKGREAMRPGREAARGRRRAGRVPPPAADAHGSRDHAGTRPPPRRGPRGCVRGAWCALARCRSRAPPHAASADRGRRVRRSR